jgi:hypothetical protein
VNKRVQLSKDVPTRAFIAKIVITDGPESLPGPPDVGLAAR